MLYRCKVFKDHDKYIAKFPQGEVATGPRGSRFSSEKREIFNLLYQEAQEKNVSKKEMVSYIEDRNRELYDIESWFVEDDVKELYKQKVNAQHKRIKRYEQKVYLNPWSYFVTFTYDDKKETAESFEGRLKKALSNFSSRHGWRYIGAEERGELGGRLHYHFVIWIAPGEMVGKLFNDHKYSKKRKKMEFFLNNTYFQDRFGQSCWEPVTDEDMKNGKVRRYLIKYLNKSGGRLIYSRGVPAEYETEIDTEKDVEYTYCRYSIRAVLRDEIFGEPKDLWFQFDDEYVDECKPFDGFERWSLSTDIILA